MNKHTNEPQFHKPTPDSFSAEYPVAVLFFDLMKTYRTISWHWHEELEIVIVNSGSLEVQYDDNHMLLNSGEAVFFNQFVMHSLKSADSKRCSFYSVKFNPSFLFPYDQPIMRSKYMIPVLNSPELKMLALNDSRNLDEEIIDSINNLIAANVSKKNGYELTSKGCLCTFWLLLLRHLQQLPGTDAAALKTSASLDEERIKNAITYINEHYAESISLEDISNSVHISKSECCRCFKRMLHLTPFEYLMKYRIQNAALKLAEDSNTKSISQLALSAGFNNTSYFNKIFKQNLGCTPSEYRRNIQQAKQFDSPNSIYNPYKF